MKYTAGEDIGPYLEWADSYANAEVSCYAVLSWIGSAVGVRRRSRRQTLVNKDGVTTWNKSTRTFNPIVAKGMQIIFSEVVEYGVRESGSHPDAPLSTPTFITPRVRVSGEGSLNDDLVRPLLILTVADGMPELTAVCTEAFMDPQAAQASQRRYMSHLSEAAEAIGRSGGLPVL